MYQKQITLEKELALHLSQINPGKRTRSNATQIIHNGINWNSFLNFCQGEGITSLVWRNLNVMKELSSDVQDNTGQFKNVYKNTLQANLRLLHSFESLLKRFEEEKIPILLLQGIALLEMVYEDIGLRALGDIDILVKEEHREKLKNIFYPLGFTNIRHYPSLFSGDGMLLDIHTDIANLDRIRSRNYALTINSKSLWQASRELTSSQPLVRLLSLEDMILTLCAHMQKHSYGSIIWFVDINEILRKYKDDIDWEKLISRASEFKVTKPLYFSLEFINHYWTGLEGVPSLSLLRDSKLNLMQRASLKKIINLEKIDSWGDILYLFEIKKRRHKFYFMFETLFPRPKVMAQIFNISHPLFLIVAYPLRLWQIVFIGFRAIMKWLFPSYA